MVFVTPHAVPSCTHPPSAHSSTGSQGTRRDDADATADATDDATDDDECHGVARVCCLALPRTGIIESHVLPVLVRVSVSELEHLRGGGGRGGVVVDDGVRLARRRGGRSVRRRRTPRRDRRLRRGLQNRRR